MPLVVRKIYQPQDNFPIPGSIARPLLRYNQWWMGVDADKKELANLISQIDLSITNGMTQAEVVGLMGQPTLWYTNGNMIDAHFMYVPLGANFYGTITSGFTITFTNGAVFRKSPIIK